MDKRAILDQIEVLDSGIIRVRMTKQFVFDGEVRGFPEAHYHRCELPIGCGEKLITNIIAACGADLAKQGFPLLDEKEILEKINALTKVLWTDADRASFNRAQQERAEQAERARLAEVARAQEAAAAAEQAERQRKQEIADAVVAALAAQR